MFYIGIAVTVIAVIALIVSVISDSNRRKQKAQNAIAAIESEYVDESSAEIVDIPDDGTESGSTSSQMTVVSFVGTWYKLDTDGEKRAILNISMQYSDSFEFVLEVWSGGRSKTMTGTAFYTDETTAEYSPAKKTKMTLVKGDDGVTITHTGKLSAYGLADGYDMDGFFVEEEPDYYKVPITELDGTIYRSDAVVAALQDTLSEDDYNLYKELMEKGLKSAIAYERVMDINGRYVNVDTELNAVKYYCYNSEIGYDMIFICSPDAKIYIIFYTKEQLYYYTNDPDYAARMPESFEAVAKQKNLEPVFR